MGCHDVFLEHELLRVLLALAQDALVAAAVSPVVLPDLDGCGGGQGGARLLQGLSDPGACL